MKQGFVITKNKNKKEFFNSSSAYDRAIWKSLGEATVYHSANAGQNAVAKLWRAGNFAAKLVPLSEMHLDGVKLDVKDDNGEVKPGNHAELDIELNDDGDEGSDEDSSTMQGFDEEPCEHCCKEPCVCPDEDTDSGEMTDEVPGEDKGSVEASGEMTDEVPGEDSVKEPMKPMPGEEQEETAFSRSRFFKNQDVSWNGKKYTVVDDSGTGVAIISPRGDTSGRNNMRVKNNELIKESDAVRRPTDAEYMLMKQYCDGKGIKPTGVGVDRKTSEIYFQDGSGAHYSIAGVKEDEFKMPAKPELDAKPDENDDRIPDLTEPKINDLTYTDPDVINDKPATDLTTATSLPHAEKVKVPGEVMTSLKDAIDVFTRCANFNNGRDDIEGSFCMTVVNALEELEANLDLGTVEGIKQAQIKMSSWMNPITTNIPELVRDYVYRGGRKPSLKDLFDVKKGEKQLDDVRGGLNYPKGQKD